MKKKIQAFFLAMLFIFVGLGMVIYGVKSLQIAYSSKEWPTTTGIILQSKIEERRNPTSGGGGSRTYYAQILYRYTVAQRDYSSSQITIAADSGFSELAKAQSVVNQYPEEKVVKVYYNPVQPSQSILEPGIHSGAYLLPFVGALFVLGGIAFGLFMFLG